MEHTALDNAFEEAKEWAIKIQRHTDCSSIEAFDSAIRLISAFDKVSTLGLMDERLTEIAEALQLSNELQNKNS